MKRNHPAIRFETHYLEDLIKEENSCVEIKEETYHLALHPFHLTNINESIKDILNKGIARYDKKLDGILLGYQNIKLQSQTGAISNDSFFIHIDIVASFYLFKPQVEKVLCGTVNKKSEDHVGCLVHKTFNVSLPKPEDDEDWLGLKAEIGSEILFRITFIDLDGRLPYIRAEFVSIISEDDSGFSTSEENLGSKPKKIIFGSDDELEVNLSKSKKKKKDKHKKNIDVDDDNDERQTKKRKRKHSSVDNEEEIEHIKISKKKKSKHKHETNIADDEQGSKKKKKHKHKEQSYDEEIKNVDVSLGDGKKEKRKSKKHKQEDTESLDELASAVLERTLHELSEDVNSETKKKKKSKNIKREVLENNEFNITLPDLNLETLFDDEQKTKLLINGNFVMADDEDKRLKKRLSVYANSSVENKTDLLPDSDLEKLFKDVDKNKVKMEVSVKKRRRSTSSDDFETQRKKKKKMN